MNGKKRRISTRNSLIIIFVILIIIAGYLVITNLPPEEHFYTPEEVLNNVNNFLNRGSIVIKGYYIIDTGNPAVVSTLSATAARASIKLNTNNLDSTEAGKLRTETIFKFTGVLKYEDENNPLSGYIFNVEQIQLV